MLPSIVRLVRGDVLDQPLMRALTYALFAAVAFCNAGRDVGVVLLVVRCVWWCVCVCVWCAATFAATVTVSHSVKISYIFRWLNIRLCSVELQTLNCAKAFSLRTRVVNIETLKTTHTIDNNNNASSSFSTIFVVIVVILILQF